MAVPRNRHSNARKNTKRAHHAKVPKNTSSCPNCSAPRMPHTLCQACGFYRGKAVVAQEAS